MQLRIHPWFLTAILVGVCFLGLFGIYTYKWRTPMSVTEIVGSLPSEKAVVAFVDVDKLRAGGYLDLLMSSGATEESDYRSFVEESRFDYKSDLDQLAIAFKDDDRFAVAVGRFDWAQLRKFTEKRGGKCHNGFCESPASEFGRINSFYSIRTNVMAYGSGKTPGLAHSARVGASPAHNWPTAPAWIRVPGSYFTNQRGLPDGTKMFASALSATTDSIFQLNATPVGSVELTAEMYCRDESVASRLEKQLSDATGLLQKLLAREKKTPNPSDLSGVLSSGTFRREQSVVSARWKLDRTFLRALADGNF